MKLIAKFSTACSAFVNIMKFQSLLLQIAQVKACSDLIFMIMHQKRFFLNFCDTFCSKKMSFLSISLLLRNHTNSCVIQFMTFQSDISESEQVYLCSASCSSIMTV